MSKQDVIEVEGVVTEAYPNAMVAPNEVSSTNHSSALRPRNDTAMENAMMKMMVVMTGITRSSFPRKARASAIIPASIAPVAARIEIAAPTTNTKKMIPEAWDIPPFRAANRVSSLTGVCST